MDRNMTINWKPVTEQPKKGFGWFAVARLPKNHSGSAESTEVNTEGDNSWRRSFGFSKAWLNNGEWWEADVHAKQSINITGLVTHWAELPEVPELTEPFYSTHKGSWLWSTKNKQEWKEHILKELKKEKKCLSSEFYTDNEEDFAKGFMYALAILNGYR
jgi:hypothetical protein